MGGHISYAADLVTVNTFRLRELLKEGSSTRADTFILRKWSGCKEAIEEIWKALTKGFPVK